MFESSYAVNFISNGGDIMFFLESEERFGYK